MVKNLSRILLVVMAIMLIATVTFAADTPLDFQGAEDEAEVSSIYTIGGRIIGGIRGVAMIAAVAVLAVLGVKYMLGSTEEKAEYKKTMLPYVIGAVLVFAASAIAGMVYNFASTIS